MAARSQPTTASSRDDYLSQFSHSLHSYIDDIVDVSDNENYGFVLLQLYLNKAKSHGLWFEHS